MILQHHKNHDISVIAVSAEISAAGKNRDTDVIAPQRWMMRKPAKLRRAHRVPSLARALHIGDPMKTTKTTRSTRPQIMTAVPGVVVSIPDVGWYITAKGGARHPLDDRRFATMAEAQGALRAFNRGS
jgi:hypothetical protein